jgi:hypothetical protein
MDDQAKHNGMISEAIVFLSHFNDFPIQEGHCLEIGGVRPQSLLASIDR